MCAETSGRFIPSPSQEWVVGVHAKGLQRFADTQGGPSSALTPVTATGPRFLHSPCSCPDEKGPTVLCNAVHALPTALQCPPTTFEGGTLHSHTRCQATRVSCLTKCTGLWCPLHLKRPYPCVHVMPSSPSRGVVQVDGSSTAQSHTFLRDCTSLQPCLWDLGCLWAWVCDCIRTQAHSGGGAGALLLLVPVVLLLLLQLLFLLETMLLRLLLKLLYCCVRAVAIAMVGCGWL